MFTSPLQPAYTTPHKQQAAPGGPPSSVTTSRRWRTPLWLALILLASPGLSQTVSHLLGTTPEILQSTNPATSGGSFIAYGASVALDGDLLVVGAPSEDSATTIATDVGAVYIYERQGAQWTEIEKLRAPAEAGFAKFGASVGVARGSDTSGEIDVLIVGEPGFQTDDGKAHIFHRTSGGSWQFEATFDSASANESFGSGVAIDFFIPPNSLTNDPLFFIAIGAPRKKDPSDSGNNLHGSVTILQRTGAPATWGATHEFFGLPNEFLGRSVAMAGPDVVVSAEGLEGLGNGDGGARHYRQANDTGGSFNYAFERFLKPEARAAHVGTVAVAATYDAFQLGTAAMGAPFDDTIATDAGKVFIFDLAPGGTGDTRTQVADLEPATLAAGSEFGASVALSGKGLAVGAPRAGLSAGISGTVFLFEQGATKADWTLVGTLTPPAINPVFTCEGGASAALEGLTLAIGCPVNGNAQDEEARVYSGAGVFSDGFESGSTGEWSSATP